MMFERFVINIFLLMLFLNAGLIRNSVHAEMPDHGHFHVETEADLDESYQALQCRGDREGQDQEKGADLERNKPSTQVGRVFEQVQHQKPKKYNLCICAIFKNEARYLKEWIEYHRLVGVDHFYLYNNNSVDRFLEVLKPYITRGIVTLFHWPDYLKILKEEDVFLWALGTQIPAYENAAKVRALNETKWLAFLDIGEFLIPTRTSTFKEILEQYEEYPGITFMSDYYDASRLNVAPERNFLIETVELTFPPEENHMKGVEKMIFKPEQCEYFLWPPYKCLFKGNQAAIAVDRRDIRINHYVNRFNGFLYFGKIKDKLHIDNRLISNDQTRELLRLGYEIEDQERVIFRFLPEMQKRIGLNDVIWK